MWLTERPPLSSSRLEFTAENSCRRLIEIKLWAEGRARKVPIAITPHQIGNVTDQIANRTHQRSNVTDQIANLTGQLVNLASPITNLVHHIANSTDQIGNLSHPNAFRTKKPFHANVTFY